MMSCHIIKSTLIIQDIVFFCEQSKNVVHYSTLTMQTLKTDIKQRILQVAHREFINNGVQRTCIRNVAHKAGVTVGNLYHYFDSKDTLFRAVLQPLLTALDRYILSHNDEEFLSLEVFDLRNIKSITLCRCSHLSSSSALNCDCYSSMLKELHWRGIRIKSSTTRCR